MRKWLLLLLVILLQSCIGGYGKLELASLKDVRIKSVSLVSTEVVASAYVLNNSRKELDISGLEICSDQLEGVKLSLDTAILIPRGMNLVEIPATITYSPFSFLNLISGVDKEYTLRIHIELPTRNLKLKKKISGTQVVNFLNRVGK